MSIFLVRLCQMTVGGLGAPYDGTSIEAETPAIALGKAKKWAASVKVADNSWLQLLLDGQTIFSLEPGFF